MAPSPDRTIIIVGGGFSGTALAANLLRNPPPTPTRIVLIERGAEIGRGVAYAARGYPYLLNVPADRMSATSSEPAQFAQFARRRDPTICPESFLPRHLYGEYLQEFLLAAELAAPRHVRLEKFQGQVTSLVRPNNLGPLHVTLADGRTLLGDDVVLACGNPPPANPPGAEALDGHPRYVRDACSDIDRPAFDGTTLLIGTGLTMADTAIAAAENPHVVLRAVSRHGLVPPCQTPARLAALEGDGVAALLASASSLRSLVRAARTLAREAEARGADWREVVNLIRHNAPALWRRLPDCDRRRFLRHFRAYWDMHRHRLPPPVINRLGELRRSGRFKVHAGRIREMRPERAGIRLSWRARGSSTTQHMLVDWVVNCTGPDYDLRRSTDPLFKSALRTGLAFPDECGLGLRTGKHGSIIGSNGSPCTHLYYLGPMLRAAHWEATAVAELRGHAERLATHLSTDEHRASH